MRLYTSWSSGQEGLYGVRSGRPVCRDQEGSYNVRNQEGSYNIQARKAYMELGQEGLYVGTRKVPMELGQEGLYVGTRKVPMEFEARKASLQWPGRPIVEWSRLIKP